MTSSFFKIKQVVPGCDQNVATCDQLVSRCDHMLPGVTRTYTYVIRCDQLLPVVTRSCFLYCKIPKHVLGHISCLEAGPWTKIGQNDRNVEPVHQKKFGGDSWPYKIETAPNVPD